jgi:GT2 family glycosyltransferase
MTFKALLRWWVAAWESAGLGAFPLLLRYARLTVANRTSQGRVIRRVPSPLGTEKACSALVPEGDAVIPVYNNFEDTAALLQALAGDTSFAGRIIIVHDASSDVRVVPLLAQFAESHANITLITHEKNMGFVAACNRGMAESQRDVVILNTDIGLAPGVMNRMLARLQCARDIATVTPLSNAAYGVGFPLLVYENTVPFGASTAQIDAAFAALRPVENIELATGIGFCMGISRAALSKLGAFDAHFGQGYGEETDFCQRARKAGLRNVLASDCYVMHKGGQSFGSSWQDKARKGLIKVLARHPDYPARVGNYLAAGETRALGFAALVGLAETMSGARVLVEGATAEGAEAGSSGSRPDIAITEQGGVCTACVRFAGESYGYSFANRDLVTRTLALLPGERRCVTCL